MSEPQNPEESGGRMSAWTPWPIQTYVLGAILIVLFIIVCRLFAPFFTLLLWSTLLFTLIGPLHQRITRNMKFSSPLGIIGKNLLAGVFALGTVILIIIPLSFVGSQFFRQIMELVRFARDYFAGNPDFFSEIFSYVADLIRDLSSGLIVIDPEDIQSRIFMFLSSGIQEILSVSRVLAMDIGSFVMNIFFMLFCLYFFYIDGAYLSRLALHTIPIRKEYLSALVGKFKDITRNLFLGYIVIALLQAMIAYVIFLIFQVKGALVFAGLTLLCAFIPMFGAGLVWLPLGLVRMLDGSFMDGLIFLAVSGVLISTLDNFLRPILLQNRIQLHPLVIFFAILGGIGAFGFNGLILGPMMVILFLTVLDMFLSEHKINEQKIDN